ncbi:virulence RhuM family protein [Gillisia hiemivivida]|uniref:Virulence RhuM family protein n=1 Tax=Gillisia hiemivivida TaxID=291190 RepID=A0A5C6ZTA4_9FLAO|nr:virulence RhuM family protein [Gillisia hiemivivida]TXD93773.1 virulence RhuM family protein [Gillisia hiemivivida]
MASELIIYQTEDGQTKIQTRLENETVWLTQTQMATLFGKGRSTITEHITNIFKEGELDKALVSRKIRHTTQHGAIVGKTQEAESTFYNLDVIISVGYRVKSNNGTQFRIWATQRLREYIVKGFTINDDLLKEAGGGNYFEELLERIRDIRSSEKVFWRKVLDIYATSVDYNPNAETSQQFFKTIQNKMHWAAHGQTAAEVIYSRIDPAKPYLGLTTFKGEQPTKQEVGVAKNYLNGEELNILNRMVTAYLEIAELQALNSKPMYMKDWLQRVDDFLQLTGKNILTHAGSISHKEALEKATHDYTQYKESIKNSLSKVEKDFIKQLDQTHKQLKNKK